MPAGPLLAEWSCSTAIDAVTCAVAAVAIWRERDTDPPLERAL
jgi:hypothetical protein